MYKSAKKRNKILKNEKKLAIIHGSILLSCSSPACNNKAKVTEEEAKRVFVCSKCGIGFMKKNNGP